MAEEDGYATIDAEVPLSEMFDMPQSFALPHRKGGIHNDLSLSSRSKSVQEDLIKKFEEKPVSMMSGIQIDKSQFFSDKFC